MGIFDFFKPKKSLGIGIDIGSSAIKVAITSPQKEGAYKIEDILIEPLPPAVVEKGDIKDEKEVLKHLKSIKKKLPSGYITYAFSPYKTTLFSFQVIKEVKDVEELIEKELTHRIPLPLYELSVDYTVSELPNKNKVITVVVGKQKAIDSTVNLLEDAGINIDSVTSTYTAIANTAMLCYPGLTEDEGGLIVDFGHTMSPCVCINQGIITHGGCIEAGTRLMESFLQEALSLKSLEEAKEQMIKGKIPTTLADQAIIRYLDRVIPELDAYATMCQGESPIPCKEFNLIGSGGGATVRDLLQQIGMRLSEPFMIKLLDARKGFLLSKDVELKLQNLGALRFTIALGASLI